MRAQLEGETDFAGFRVHARRLLAQQVPPHEVQWSRCAHDDDLLSTATADDTGRADGPSLRVPASFLALCESVALHADPQRFALLYRLLWRLAREPALRLDPLDDDKMRAFDMAHAVRRDIHKMRAFLRFREVPEAHAPAGVLHVAWFEPDHHIVRANAPWFMQRFTQMHWAILTPTCCAAWDGSQLQFRAGAQRADAPPADAGEQLWLTYYQSIFNPARLKLAMMQKEMPRKYWRNLPEAQLIAPLAARAHERSGIMVEQPPTQPARRIAPLLRAPGAAPAAMAHATLPQLQTEVERCRACPIGAMATQAVPGEGPLRPSVMFVGEQPGDQEDLRGRPFAGPAGQLLDRALAQLQIDRASVFVTNAVRHFKFELRGKRRIHKTPSQAEAAACQHWLEEEIALVQPGVLVALGATAARALLRRPVAVMSERGQWFARPDGRRVLVTVHPSALLRIAPELQATAFDEFVRDLALAGARHRDRMDGPAASDAG